MKAEVENIAHMSNIAALETAVSGELVQLSSLHRVLLAAQGYIFLPYYLVWSELILDHSKLQS
jgi:hypothetical protein